MAREAVVGGWELHISGGEWETLRAHLFPGDGDEHGAALLCGIAMSGRRKRLLVRHVVLATDGVDYIPGRRGYRELTGQFVTQQIRRAKDLGLAYVPVHCHSGRYSVGFSPTDLDSHERGYPTLVGLLRQPVVGLVLAQEAAAGDVWLPDGTREELDHVVVIGRTRRVLTSEPDRTVAVADARYDRQTLLYGSKGQQILQAATVAVVGAGGVGMLLVEYLSRLGVGHLIVIDPERVDPTNLPRLPGATRLDAMEWLRRDTAPRWAKTLGARMAARKVRVARRIAIRANPTMTFEAICGDVADDHVARRLTDADFIFLAADTMLARDVVNQVAYQYLIPTLQVGSKVVTHKETGDILDVFGVVRALATSVGCLRCSGLINVQRLAEEALGDPVQVANQRYVDDPEVKAPSVITLNAMAAGWAANDFLQFIVGLPLGRPAVGHRLLRTHAGHVTVQEPAVRDACHVCGSGDTSALAFGDLRDLPTRLTPQA